MAKAFTEARKQHGDSELLDEIAATKPEMDRARAWLSLTSSSSTTSTDVRQRSRCSRQRRATRRSRSTGSSSVGLAGAGAVGPQGGSMGLSGERVSDAQACRNRRDRSCSALIAEYPRDW